MQTLDGLIGSSENLVAESEPQQLHPTDEELPPEPQQQPAEVDNPVAVDAEQRKDPAEQEQLEQLYL